MPIALHYPPLQVLFCWWMIGWAFVGLQARPGGGSEVVLVYNSNISASRDVAEYYSRQRGVAANQLIGLELLNSETNRIERASFEKRIAEPLIRELQDRGLMKFSQVTIPPTNGIPERRVRVATESKVRYLVLCFGMPYFIPPDISINAFRDEGIPEGTPQELLRNCASVDAELVLLPCHHLAPASGAFPNPAYAETNIAHLHPTNAVFLVCRLDGPTPQLAKGLVDKAREAERDGLNGRAYFDLRGLKSGDYVLGDQWLGHGAEVCEAFGYDTFIDRQEAVLTAGFPLSEVAIYGGWYSMQVTGPFTQPTVEFMPGAIAYHLFSFSASNPRDPVGCWVGALIGKGAAVTMGCVDEPYLGMTPNFGLFLERLALMKMTVGEAALTCQPVLSWQTLVIGDPLYRPFARTVSEWDDWYSLHPSPKSAWNFIRKVNLFLKQSKDPGAALKALLEQPLAINSPVLGEKISMLSKALGNDEQAIQWARTAITHGATPQQKARILRTLAQWQGTAHPMAALKALDEFVELFPDHPDLLAVRREQLALASQSGLADRAVGLEREVQRLTPTNSPPTTGKK